MEERAEDAWGEGLMVEYTLTLGPGAEKLANDFYLGNGLKNNSSEGGLTSGAIVRARINVALPSHHSLRWNRFSSFYAYIEANTPVRVYLSLRSCWKSV